MKPLTKIGLGVTALWVLSNTLLGLYVPGDFSAMSLNEWGDFLAGVSAPLALLWLVIGYFQHGEELRLNTKALSAQQEELRRQVEETATLARNAERQARAAENLVNLNREEHDRAALREVMDAQPEFAAYGGSYSTVEISQEIVNRGAAATDIEFHPAGPYVVTPPSLRRLDSDAKADITVRHARGEPLQYPIPFGISYTDRLGHQRRRELEIHEGADLRDVPDPTTSGLSSNGPTSS